MKAFLKSSLIAASLLAGSSAFAAGPAPAAIAGRWDAVLNRDGVDIPFRLDLKADGQKLQGVLYDGFRANEQTSGASFEDGKLVLELQQYLTTLNAKFENGQLKGEIVSRNVQSANYPFRATRHVERPATTVNAPQIAGTWEIPLSAPSSKGEKAFRFVVQQQGAEVSATILRIDGDTGSYTGTFENGKWLLSHFDGSRPSLIAVTPKADGTLDIAQLVTFKTPPRADGKQDGHNADVFVAYRPEVARANGFAQPDDSMTHTKVADPEASFKFAFPDNDGRIVTNDDPRFKGKVVLVTITGTWCPNCHDEARYLADLDREYRGKGKDLAIVAFNFEDEEQQGKLTRQKAFVKQYGIEYTYLQAGAPSELHEKVPQLDNLDTWPAAIFIGRDGKVKAVHAGFASPASGDYHKQLQRDFVDRIDALLAEPAPKVADASSSAARQVAAR